MPHRCQRRQRPGIWGRFWPGPNPWSGFAPARCGPPLRRAGEVGGWGPRITDRPEKLQTVKQKTPNSGLNAAFLRTGLDPIETLAKGPERGRRVPNVHDDQSQTGWTIAKSRSRVSPRFFI